MTASAKHVVLASILCYACDAGAPTPGGPGEVVHPRDEDRLSTHTTVSAVEIAYDPEVIATKVRERDAAGRRFSIIVVAEGAHPAGGEPSFADGSGRYGGIAERLATQIQERTGKETRTLVLGHIQRGGSPIAYDRNLALRFGAAAVRCIQEGNLGTMVALKGNDVRAVPLADAVRELKRVPLESDIVQTARQLGISFGD